MSLDLRIPYTQTSTTCSNLQGRSTIALSVRVRKLYPPPLSLTQRNGFDIVRSPPEIYGPTKKNDLFPPSRSQPNRRRPFNHSQFYRNTKRKRVRCPACRPPTFRDRNERTPYEVNTTKRRADGERPGLNGNPSLIHLQLSVWSSDIDREFCHEFGPHYQSVSYIFRIVF